MPLKNLTSVLWIFWILTGIVMEGIYLYWCYAWWGLIGLALGIVLTPLAAIFPIIYLFKIGFSGWYFGLWGISLIIIIMIEIISEIDKR